MRIDEDRKEYPPYIRPFANRIRDSWNED